MKKFGGYLDRAGSDRFLNLFWHRVQEPSGTTNADFEFNRSKTKTANTAIPRRTAGDLLVRCDPSRGGTNPVLFVSRWIASGPASQREAASSLPWWATKTDPTAAGDATGSI